MGEEEIEGTEFPAEYSQVLDEVVTQESFTTKYQVTGAEFTGARTVKVPERVLDGTGTEKYNHFRNPKEAKVVYTSYTLDQDREKAFTADALDVIDQPQLELMGTAADFERQFLIPEIDTNFFNTVAAKAMTNAKTDLTASNIKEELRNARTQMLNQGYKSADLYMTSDALACLEEAIDRQFAGEGTITDTIGRYNIFNVFEVPEGLLGVDFAVIGEGAANKRAIRHIWKRVVSKYFSPEVNQSGDDHLLQMRWVYGCIALKNKVGAMYVSKGTNAPDCSQKPAKFVQFVNGTPQVVAAAPQGDSVPVNDTEAAGGKVEVTGDDAKTTKESK